MRIVRVLSCGTSYPENMEERHTSPVQPDGTVAYYVRARLEAGHFPVREYPSQETATFIAECLAARPRVKGCLEAPHEHRTIQEIEVYSVTKQARGERILEVEHVLDRFVTQQGGTLVRAGVETVSLT